MFRPKAMPGLAFTSQWRDPRLEGELMAIGLERPEQLGTLFIGDAAYLKELTRGDKPVQDNYPKRILAPPSSWTTPFPLYFAWLEVEEPRERFLVSPLIRKLWPADLIEPTLPYFDFQKALNYNDYIWKPRKDIDIPSLHNVLTRSDLRAPALWLMKSDEDLQRLCLEATPDQTEGSEYKYHVAAGLVADRDFEAALEPDYKNFHRGFAPIAISMNGPAASVKDEAEAFFVG